MFTGIIQALGELRLAEPLDSGLKIEVDISSLDNRSVQIGDSISINGACLTVTRLKEPVASFDLSAETLENCLMNSWREGEQLNLETALTLNTPLGGHLVSGHVDGTASVAERVAHAEFTKMTFLTAQSIGKFIAAKGSVAIDGISLTTNTVCDIDNNTEFSIMLVPHTLENTTLGGTVVGDFVHIEVDQVARYAERLQQWELSNQ